MSDPQAKAEHSRYKDERQSPVDEFTLQHRKRFTRKRNYKRAFVVAVEYRARWWSRILGLSGWRVWGRYRTEGEANIVAEKIKTKSPDDGVRVYEKHTKSY